MRESVNLTASSALGPVWSLMGCPYIEQWFAQHAGTDAASLERLAMRFAGAPKVAAARDYFAPIGARLTQGIERWRSGGNVAADLASAGLGVAAKAAAQSPPAPEAADEPGAAAATSGAAGAKDGAESAAPKTGTLSATPEIDATGDATGKRVVEDMNKANAGPNTLDAGIHYWYNYRALCKAQDPTRWDDKLKAGMADPKYWDQAKILADPGSDAIDGHFRKGGFSVTAGVTLDVAKIAAVRP